MPNTQRHSINNNPSFSLEICIKFESYQTGIHDKGHALNSLLFPGCTKVGCILATSTGYLDSGSTHKVIERHLLNKDRVQQEACGCTKWTGTLPSAGGAEGAPNPVGEKAALGT